MGKTGQYMRRDTELVRMALGLVLVSFMTAWASAAPVFRAAVRVAGDSGLKAHLSRSTRGQLAWTAEGKLALVYAQHPNSEGISRDVPRTARVIFREWTNEDGWGEAVTLSPTSTAGAFQPALVRRPDGSLFVAWQDYRHCTSAGNMMNNLEIYGRMRAADGQWLPEARITQTNSGTNGDNGFLPKPVALSDGKVGLTWFDFFWPSEGVGWWPAEVAVKVSNTGGGFPDASMTNVIHTVPADRAMDTDEGASFTAPDVAVDGYGFLNLVWGTDIGTPESANLYYGQVNPATGAWTARTRIHTGAGGLQDPAKILTDAAGDVWLLYTDGATYGNREVMLQRKPKGGWLDPAVRLTSDAAHQQFADAAFDSAGRLHCVYVSGTEQTNTLKYLVYDPVAKAITEQASLPFSCQGDSANDLYSRVAIAMDAADNIYLVWSSNGAVWFTTSASEPPRNAAEGWGMYE